MDLIQKDWDLGVHTIQQHIDAVNRNYVKLCEALGMPLRNLHHDQDKLTSKGGLLYPYMWICKGYREHKKPQDYGTDAAGNSIQNICYEATLSHVVLNKHHPEYWEYLITHTCTGMISIDNRDAVSNPTDARLMPRQYLQEMACDWKATGDARGNTATSWADDNIGKRWLFSPEQIDVIYQALAILEPDA